MASYPVPQSSDQPREVLHERVQRLAEIWHAETGALSSMTQAQQHPAYQEIISLGPDVLPLLRDWEENHIH